MPINLIMKKIYTTLVAIIAIVHFSYGQSLPLTAGSTSPLSGVLVTNVSGNNQIALNNPAVNWGFIGNPATNVWSLGYGTTVTSLGTPVLNWTTDGKIGIGTTNPQSILDIGKNQTTPAFRLGNSIYGLSYNSVWGLQGGAQSIMIFGNNGQNEIRAGNTNAGGYLDFFTNNTADYTLASNGNFAMRLASNGSVGIGTTQPDSKLTVNGTIHSKEVKVDASIPVPDYVFEPNYKVLQLSELKTYLAVNHHLPEIPSAAEMDKNGINLSEMNLKLLKKVEELTLYLIEKDSQIESLKKSNQIQAADLNKQKQINKENDARLRILEKSLDKLKQKLIKQ
jgi:hypothetical protein